MTGSLGFWSLKSLKLFLLTPISLRGGLPQLGVVKNTNVRYAKMSRGRFSQKGTLLLLYGSLKVINWFKLFWRKENMKITNTFIRYNQFIDVLFVNLLSQSVINAHISFHFLSLYSYSIRTWTSFLATLKDKIRTCRDLNFIKSRIAIVISTQ